MGTALFLLAFRRTRGFVSIAAALSFFSLAGRPGLAQQVGDEWTARRGDSNPELTYTSMVTTGSGRMIAVSDGGQLMISDNGGSAWTFSRIRTVNGGVKGRITDMKEFTIGNSGSRRLIATAVYLAKGGPLGFVGRTVLYLSASDGNSWTELPFPHDSIDFGGGTNFEGVVLRGLQVSPAGEILAYGTTNLAAFPTVVWSIGGAIYRSVDGVNWNLAKFAYGPLYHMSPAGGRLIAVGANTALDSADGAGWNGYFLENAQLMDGGQPLASDLADRIRLYDVVEKSGTFTAYGIIHKRIGTILESPTIERQFTMTSTAPFGGGRIWTIHDQATYPGVLDAGGSSLLGFSRLGGVKASSDGGATFSTVTTSPRAVERSFTRSGSNITVVNSSQEVWKSTNDGVAWSKIYSVPTIPSIRPFGVQFGRLYGRSYDSGYKGVYTSEDNGETWDLVSTAEGGVIQRVANRLVMSTPGSTQTMQVSDDEGMTWQSRTVDSASSAGGYDIVVTPTGRLVLSAVGRDIFGNGKFYVSDDQGETWQPRIVGTQWNEAPGALFCTEEGTLMCVSNTFASFNPRLFRSEDNGDTWTSSYYFRTLPGLDPITGDPVNKVFTAALIRQGASGRLM
ncbi:MAG: hypothetical protein KDK97_04165, partial [Verrucomicrobiales bacterium]|nr:hypothetical protein [Verrucomicrobiales bacterium]